MKTKSTNLTSLLVVCVFCILTFIRCNDDKDPSSRPYDPSKPLVCESFTPDSGGVGTKMIIKGHNFGNDPSIVKVTIVNQNMREAKVVNCTNERIYAIVPARADNGFVNVQVGEGDQMKEYTFEEEFEYTFAENVSTLTGGGSEIENRDGTFAEALFEDCMYLEIDDEGYLYVLEQEVPGVRDVKKLRILDLNAQTVTTPWTGTKVHRTLSMAFNPDKDTLFMGIEGGNTNVSSVTLLRANGFIKEKIFSTMGGSNGTAVNPVDGELFVNNYWDGSIYWWDRENQTTVNVAKPLPNNADFVFCWSLDGKTLYYVAREGADQGHIGMLDYDFSTKSLSNPRIWVGSRNTAGYQDGMGEDARFNGPGQMVAGPDGDYFVADRYNHCIRRILPDGTVLTHAGMPTVSGFDEGKPIGEAKFNTPAGIAISSDGSTIYVADRGNRRICKIVVE